MSVDQYDVKEQWLGTGALTDYTFDFKIEQPGFLLLYIQDTDGDLFAKFRGDDPTYLSGLTYDPVKGGGTISLASVLASDYVLTALLANDAPTQPTAFGDKFSFSLKSLERALDFLVSPIQRLAYLANRSVKLHDFDDPDAFDPTLPAGIVNNPGAVPSVNDAGSAWEFAVTKGQIAAAEGFAEDAEDSKETASAAAIASAASAAAAAASAASSTSGADAAALAAAAAAVSTASAALSAAAAALSGFVDGAIHAVVDGQAATALTDETVDSAVRNSALFFYQIIRGTTVFANGWIALQYLNGSWRIKESPYVGELHGVTWTLSGTTVAQLLAALDVGAGNGTIRLKKTYYANS